MSGRLAVVTVSYYSGAQLLTMVDSVRRQSDAPVVVANNAADDDLASLAELPGVRVERMPGNVGYGTAVNRAVAALGADASGFDWYLVVNPDVEFVAGSIGLLVAAAEANGRAGAVGPLIRTAAGTVYPSARRLPSLSVGIGHALFANIWLGNPWTARYLEDARDPSQAREPGWVSGSCMLLRREAFEQVGGFDESYFMYFEDVDLCRRIAHAGWRILYAPTAEVVHTGGHATLKPDVGRAMLVAHHRSAYRYLSRRYRAWYLWPLRLALRVGLAVRARLR